MPENASSMSASLEYVGTVLAAMDGPTSSVTTPTTSPEESPSLNTPNFSMNETPIYPFSCDDTSVINKSGLFNRQTNTDLLKLTETRESSDSMTKTMDLITGYNESEVEGLESLAAEEVETLLAELDKDPLQPSLTSDTHSVTPHTEKSNPKAPPPVDPQETSPATVDCSILSEFLNFDSFVVEGFDANDLNQLLMEEKDSFSSINGLLPSLQPSPAPESFLDFADPFLDANIDLAQYLTTSDGNNDENDEGTVDISTCFDDLLTESPFTPTTSGEPEEQEAVAMTVDPVEEIDIVEAATEEVASTVVQGLPFVPLVAHSHAPTSPTTVTKSRNKRKSPSKVPIPSPADHHLHKTHASAGTLIMKDNKYWERRKKNNIASQNSRRTRKEKRVAMQEEMVTLESTNAQLKATIDWLTRETTDMRQQLLTLIG